MVLPGLLFNPQCAASIGGLCRRDTCAGAITLTYQVGQTFSASSLKVVPATGSSSGFQVCAEGRGATNPACNPPPPPPPPFVAVAPTRCIGFLCQGWYFGQPNDGNLLGTIKSLDELGVTPLNCTLNANIRIHDVRWLGSAPGGIVAGLSRFALASTRGRNPSTASGA
jgi:hypothetical protein